MKSDVIKIIKIIAGEIYFIEILSKFFTNGLLTPTSAERLSIFQTYPHKMQIPKAPRGISSLSDIKLSKSKKFILKILKLLNFPNDIDAGIPITDITNALINAALFLLSFSLFIMYETITSSSDIADVTAAKRISRKKITAKKRPPLI